MFQDEDIVSVARTLGESLFEAEVDFAGDSAATLTAPVASQVDVHGSFAGSVTVGCSEGLARRLAARMFGVPEARVTADEQRDAIRELSNVVAGNLKALLPPPSEIGLPVNVVDFSGAPRGDELNRLAFVCAGEPLLISIRPAA